jgi:hypothetical protein
VHGEKQLKQWLQNNAINLSVSAVQNRDVVSDNNDSNRKKCSSVKFLGLKRKSFDERSSSEGTNVKWKRYNVLPALKSLDLRKSIFKKNGKIFGKNGKTIKENFETKTIKEENEIDQNFAKPNVSRLAGRSASLQLKDSQQMAHFCESHTEKDVSYNNINDASLNKTDSVIKISYKEKSDFLKKYKGIVSIDQSFFDMPKDIMSRVMDYVVENVQDTLEENNGAHIFVEYSEGIAQIRDCVNFQDVKIAHDSMSLTRIIKGVLPPEKKDSKIAVTRDNSVTIRK